MKSYVYLLIAQLLSLAVITVQDPDMSLSVPQGVPLYRGQPVHIDCTTTDSDFLGWRSIEYVGDEDVAVQGGSQRKTTTMGAIISVLEASGQTLRSRLDFNVSTNARNSSVMCVNIDQRREDSINITSRDDSATLLSIVSEQEKFCDGDEVVVECTARSSLFIEWEVDGQRVSRCSSSEVSDNGDLQTACNLTVTLHEGLNQVTCVNVEVGVTNTTEIQIADSDACRQLVSDATTTTTTTVTVAVPQPSTQEDDVTPELSKAASFYSCGLVLGILYAVILTAV